MTTTSVVQGHLYPFH